MIDKTILYMTGVMVVGMLFVGCANNSSTKGKAESGTTPAVVVPPPNAERATLTRAECTAKGGQIVGDIGDGAIHRPDYTCESGQPPIGSIRPAEGEPIATEGEVCCP